MHTIIGDKFPAPRRARCDNKFGQNNFSLQNNFNIVIFRECFSLYLLGIMAHNVPAVYDVFASPIKETVGFQGLQKCGWSGAWEASPT
jgi:hypothetical protein